MSLTPEEDVAATELEKRIGRYFEAGDTVYYNGTETRRPAGNYVVEFAFENEQEGDYYIREPDCSPGFTAHASELTLVSKLHGET